MGESVGVVQKSASSTHAFINWKLLLCLLVQQWNGQRASMELECIKMGIFRDDENIGNSYYHKNIVDKKVLLCDIFL